MTGKKTSNLAKGDHSRRNTITLLLLLVWVVAVFTYSIMKFAKVIN